MPQMKPLMWINLYVFVLLLLMAFMVMFNFMFMYNNKYFKEEKKIHDKNNMKWLW